MRLRNAALAVAIGEAANDVREEGGENRGEKVREYLSNSGIEIAAPWCAAFVQWCADSAAGYLGVRNPLDDVNREALVLDYAILGDERAWIVEPFEARAGDLVLFEFGDAGRWNHIGFLEERLQYVVQGERRVYRSFRTVEGNTSPGVGSTSSEREREGDGVFRKVRKIANRPTLFLSWDESTSG